jgi:hypothetical protein
LSANVELPMSSTVSPPREQVARPERGALSPELVLVDPDLAEEARGWLAPSDDTVARIAELARVRSLAESRARVLELPPAAPAPAPLPPVVLMAPVGRRTRSALLGGGVAAVLAISLIVGVRVDVSGQPAGADSTIGGSAQKVAAHAPSHRAPTKKTARRTAPSKPRAKTKTPTRTHAAPATPTRHRFAWAPTKGAAGYEVEFFRAGTRVYVGHTKDPTIEVPARWQYEGAQHSFRAGEYGWYVWPLVDGKRSPQASVQTTISIAHG